MAFDGASMLKPSRGSAFVLGLALGALIWLLSPVITGRREPWDAEGGYYAGGLLLAGFLGGFVVPRRPIAAAMGILGGQAAVLLGGVVAEPANGGLWPLGLAFLAVYSALGLIGAGLGAAVARHLRSRPHG
jgi:hypothetical protein